MKVKTLKVPQTPEELQAIIVKLTTLIYKYWDEYGKKTYGHDLDIDMNVFMNMWMQDNLFIVVAENNDEMVGFIIGAKMRPLFYNEKQMFIDCFYGENDDILLSMFEHVDKLAEITGAGRVMVHTSNGDITLPEIILSKCTLSNKTYTFN